MKTTFGRMFFPAALVLLAALSAVGLSVQLLTRSSLQERSMEQIYQSARTVADVAEAYYNETYSREMDFIINLTVAARASGSDMILCDAQGTLLLCSEAPLGCAHQGMAISADYLQTIQSSEAAMNTGVIRGVYNDVRNVVSVPIRDDSGNFIGAVIASTPVTETLALLHAISNIYMAVSVLVIMVSVILMSLLARHTARPLRDVAKAATAFAHGDMTARVQEDRRMPQELRELTLAFNNMAASLEKSEYQRQEFVANVSHELKTPMTTISGFMDGILDGTIPPERQRYYMQLVSDETKRLSRLVRSMLDISRLQDQGGIREDQKTRFDISECAGQTLISFEQKILAKNLDVQVDIPSLPVYTRANQDYITQVIYNLLDNAVKFCPQDGQLTLKIRTGGSKVYVSIANSGQTIPPEELPLVFERFHKTDKSRSENRDGWGLGLYIVRTMVLCHGEDISVSSAAGQTEFTFTLPLVN